MSFIQFKKFFIYIYIYIYNKGKNKGLATSRWPRAAYMPRPI